jgi:Flp pilus assembly protein TadD
LAYLRGHAGGRIRPGWLFASVLLYTVALGFKAVPVGLPLVLLILDSTVLERRGAGRSLGVLLAEKIPYLLPAIAVSWMALQAKSLDPPSKGPPAGPARMVAQRAAVVCYGLGYYLERTAWPRDLSAYHFRPDPIEPIERRFVAHLAAVATLVVVAFLLRRRWPGIPAALLAYAILLAPNLGLVRYGLMLVADRYAYLASMPLFVVAAAWLVDRVAGSRQPAAVAALIVGAGLALVTVLSSMSFSQSRTWRDSLTLWARALEVGSGRDALLESNTGSELCKAGRVEEGMSHLRKAIAIDPADDEARESLGVELLKQGDRSEAIAQMGEAVRLAPGRSDFRHNLGLALAGWGRLDEAIGQFREAARLQPGNADVHASIGNVLVDLQRGDEAVAEFTRALLLVPGHRGAWRGLERLRDRGRPIP